MRRSKTGIEVSNCCGVPVVALADDLDTEELGICSLCKGRCEYLDDDELEAQEIREREDQEIDDRNIRMAQQS
ncbi:MAG: hypothetical protein ACOYOU_18805 [Kiritimatiellia bacterium]